MDGFLSLYPRSSRAPFCTHTAPWLSAVFPVIVTLFKVRCPPFWTLNSVLVPPVSNPLLTVMVCPLRTFIVFPGLISTPTLKLISITSSVKRLSSGHVARSSRSPALRTKDGETITFLVKVVIPSGITKVSSV